MKILNGKFRLLPLLVLIGLASFFLRAGDFVMSLDALADNTQEQKEALERGQVMSLAEIAQGTKDISSLNPGAGDEEADTENTDTENTGEDAQASENATDSDADENEQSITRKWRDALDSGLNTSEVQREIMTDLSDRRERLKKKEQTLAQREALLRAAQKELDRKYEELATLRDDIKDLLEEQSAEEQARIESLVKIYSGMKAKDAARIFNTLDIDILVDIMTRMSERKTGPILAEMQSEKARSVTIMMAEQRKLPEVPQNLRN